MRYLAALLLLAALADPAAAGTRLCNANLASATCGNVCDASGDGLLYYSLSRTDPDGAGPRVSLSDKVGGALCDLFNYQATLADGAPNPESCPQFADRMLAAAIREYVVRWLDKQDAAGKDERLAVDPVPEID